MTGRPEGLTANQLRDECGRSRPHRNPLRFLPARAPARLVGSVVFPDPPLGLAMRMAFIFILLREVSHALRRGQRPPEAVKNYAVSSRRPCSSVEVPPDSSPGTVSIIVSACSKCSI